MGIWVDHIKDCLQVRKLLQRHDTPNLRNLYWYDRRLAEVVSNTGIVKTMLWNLFSRQEDEIAGNYDWFNLYFADAGGDGRTSSAATVWRCATLESSPWHDNPSLVLDALVENAEEIATEYSAVADRIGVHPDNPSLATRGRWDGMFLWGAGGARNEELCGLCPVTTALMESLPLTTSFGFVMFSGMEPHTHIAAHSGSSNLRLRHHLGVDVPEPDRGRLRVGNEWRPWSQGGTLCFDDSFEHEVEYEGNQPRVVLVVDTWHPSLTAEDTDVLSDPVFQRFGKVKKS
jgi:hypothetical protein